MCKSTAVHNFNRVTLFPVEADVDEQYKYKHRVCGVEEGGRCGGWITENRRWFQLKVMFRADKRHAHDHKEMRRMMTDTARIRNRVFYSCQQLLIRLVHSSRTVLARNLPPSIHVLINSVCDAYSAHKYASYISSANTLLWR